MRQKYLIVSILICLALIPSVNAKCDFEILSWGFEPSSVTSGRQVTVTADVRYTADWNERCSFLVESAILYHTTPFRITIPATVTESACCPGNRNFYDLNIEMNWCNDLTGCEGRKTIILTPTAPSTGFCDHCSFRSGNPSCSDQPSYYWKGEGYYDIGIGAYNQCYRAGEPFERYDYRQGSVYVSADNGDGNGECTDFWACQVFWILTGTDILVAGVIIIIAVVAILYIRKKKGA